MDLSGAVWRKSGRSNGNGGECVEVAVVPTNGDGKEGASEVYVVRDSKNPEGGELVFTPSEWRAFVGGVKDGEFDV